MLGTGRYPKRRNRCLDLCTIAVRPDWKKRLRQLRHRYGCNVNLLSSEDTISSLREHRTSLEPHTGQQICIFTSKCFGVVCAPSSQDFDSTFDAVTAYSRDVKLD